MTEFEGFPERALEFYEGLEADNSKAYWTDHREVYESCVRTPMMALLTRLEPEFGPAKLFRPYRDVRFSNDKTPYKTAAAAAAQDSGLYLQLSAHGLMVAGGSYALATERARRLRAAIAQDRPGAALAVVVDRLRAAGFRVDGDRLKRVPKEFDVDHPRAALLTLKTLFAMAEHEPGEWLHSAAAGDRVAEAWRAFGPLNSWLRDHVGPPRA